MRALSRRGPAVLVAAAMFATACAAAPQALRAPDLAAGGNSLSVKVSGPFGAVAGAAVCAIGISGYQSCVTSTGDGRATFDVAPGIYFVTVQPPTGSRLAPRQAAVDVGQPLELSVVLDGRGSISGVVRAADGRPAAGARVCARPASDHPEVCGSVAADGAFSLTVRLVPYKLFVEGPPDGSRLVSQWALGRVTSVEADVFDARWSDVTGVEVTLVRGLVLSGAVRAARDSSAVEGAQVCTQTLAAPLPWECERTDRRGAYAALREPGRYWVWVIPPDEGGRLLPQRYDGVDLGVDASPFPLDRDRTLDVALRDGALLQGRVVYEDGATVASALVCVDTPFTTGRICRPTDAQGRYSVAVRPDTYVVQVVPPADSDAVSEYYARRRDWTEADRVRVARADVGLDVVVRRGVRLSGTVLTAGGVPVEEVPVNVSDERGFLAGTYTDARGRYSLAIPPGNYVLDVFAPRVSQLVSKQGVSLTVRGDATYDAVLEFASPEP